jgi:hypothetical protein
VSPEALWALSEGSDCIGKKNKQRNQTSNETSKQKKHLKYILNALNIHQST